MDNEEKRDPAFAAASELQSVARKISHIQDDIHEFGGDYGLDSDHSSDLLERAYDEILEVVADIMYVVDLIDGKGGDDA